MSRTDKLVPMGKLLNVIETAGYQLEYHYEDLVFINNASFIFRFDLADYETVYLHFNHECTPGAREQLTPFIKGIATDEHLNLEISSNFSVSQEAGTEELTIQFI